MSQPKPTDRKPGRPDADRTWDYWHRTDKCHTITLYIPSKLNTGEPIAGIDREGLVEAAMNFLLLEMGGATQTEGTGYYAEKGPKGKIAKVHEEHVTLCTSLCSTETFVKQRDNLRRLANSFAIEFQQESIAVVIDDEMHFFSPTDAYIKRYNAMVMSGKMKGVSSYHKYIDARLDGGGVP
jgi:hypothetical protein